MQSETLCVGNPLRVFAESCGWYVIKTHGNQFQAGLPDYYYTHPKYSPRWVETKIHRRGLTQAQKVVFTKMLMNNVPIYIIDGVDFRGESGKQSMLAAYNMLFKEPNAHWYMMGMRNV